MSRLISDELNKVIIDAKKLGVLDDSSEMIIKDFLKNIEKEISQKKDSVQVIIGEIRALEKMATMWNNLIRNHNNMEQSNLNAEKERQDRLNNSIVEVPVVEVPVVEVPVVVKNSKVKKTTTSSKKINSFNRDK